MIKINSKSIYHPKNLDHQYFNRQMKNTYESTKSFYKFINYYINLKGKKIIDFACGNGANLFYLSKKYPVFRLCRS